MVRRNGWRIVRKPGVCGSSWVFRHELCRALHAEQNAIIQAANLGIPIEGSTLYCTTAPCSLCAKMLINAGVVRVVFDGDYPDARAMDFFQQAGVEVQQLSLNKNEQ